MDELGNQIVFKQLLDRHQRIRVPMIQRDYVQGRDDEYEVREEFLHVLHRALSLEPGDGSLPLNLDFIYGSVEGDAETHFMPLDGQQRLTTLFLLHWYLAWKDGCNDEFRTIFNSGGSSRFSYSVRPSSKEFFDALVNYCPDASPDEITSLKGLITNQLWYFRYWRLDPTIQASLSMLEAIHDKFSETDGYFQRLMDKEHPAITFQLLDLENFGLSDDLYIKMNARGKPLTAFETFKARYEQVLEEEFGNEARQIGGHSFRVPDYFARCMDTRWADFFWAHRDTKTNLYDDAVMNLFRVVELVSRDPECDSYVEDVRLLRSTYSTSSFVVFHEHGWLDRSFSETLFLLLETWSNDEAKFVCHLPNAQFFDEEAIFVKAVRSPTALTLAELVQFAGYIAYLQEDAEVDAKSFQEWMRVVFNLTVNTNYDRPADLQRSIAGIQNLASNSRSVLDYLSTTEKPVTGFSREQITEERLKSGLILAHSDWKPLIDRAEGHGYFRGQIEFLLDFCGAADKWESEEGFDWEQNTQQSLQQRFEHYLKKAETMFEARGLADLEDFRWERALLSVGDYTLNSEGNNYSFLVNSSTEPGSWKRLLSGAKLDERKYLQDLWEKLSGEGSIEDQLDEVINSATELDDWMEVLVNTPKAIGYCEKRSYRWNSENRIYLLKKVRMNGAHAELFTYGLYHNLFLEMNDRDELWPLELLDYYEVNVTDYEPGVRFGWDHHDHRINFEFERAGKGFVVYVENESLEEFPNVKKLLCDEAEFKIEGNRTRRVIRSCEVKESILSLAGALKKITGVKSSDT